MAAAPASILNVAQIGCGLIGRKRVHALPQGARLRVACDLDPARAPRLATYHAGGAAPTDHRSVVARSDVDVVFVSTLNASLAPVARDAVRAGKHVLLEKPGGLTTAELQELLDEATRHGSKVRLGYNHRFHPGLQQARTLVDSGVTGPLMFVRGRYGHGGRTGYDREWRANPALSGGGELIDQGVHLIDLASWFLGPFTEVSGHAARFYWDMPVDDNAFVSLRTAHGRTAWLHASCTEWKNLFSFEIYGRDAKIAVDGLGGSYGLERCTLFRMLPEMGPPETTTWEYPRGDNSWTMEAAAFFDDIRLDRDPSPGLADGIRILEVVESIYRSSGFPAAQTQGS